MGNMRNATKFYSEYSKERDNYEDLDVDGG